MRIQLITPAAPSARNGNSITAVRWARMLKQLGHRVFMDQIYAGARYDLMIALHARRSSESIQRFHKQHPDLPLIVALTGTDLYRDIRTSSTAQRSLELATRLVVLQQRGVDELQSVHRAKTRVILQSAQPTSPASRKRASGTRRDFRICVLAHLRH